MNLYFRFFYILFKSLFQKKTPEITVFKEKFSVLPTDCDINIHMTNSRYLSFADIGRTQALIKMGVLRKMLKRGWNGVVSAQEITYIRPLQPLQRFELETELLCWDEKYWYIEHRFMSKGKLYALALIRGVFVKGREVIPTQDVLQLIGVNTPSPQRPERIDHMIQLLAKKKEASLS